MRRPEDEGDDEGDDEDDDEDDGEDDDEDDNADMAEALSVVDKRAIGLSGADAAASESAEETSEDEEMPEDLKAMRALDKQLAAMMRLRQEESSAKRERRQQQLHFKMRVLDLLEVLVTRRDASALPSLLLLPLPLLEVLAESSSVPEQNALSERVGGLLRHKLCKLHWRPPWRPESLGAPQLFAQLEGVLSLGARFRGGGTLLAQALTDSLLLLLRVMVQHRLLTPEQVSLTPHFPHMSHPMFPCSDSIFPTRPRAARRRRRARGGWRGRRSGGRRGRRSSFQGRGDAKAQGEGRQSRTRRCRGRGGGGGT